MHNFCYFFSAIRSEYRYMQRPWYDFQVDSAEIVEAKEIENHVSPIIYCWSLQQPPWRTALTLILKIVFNHDTSFKKVHWLQDCSHKQPQAASRNFKQPPWRLGAMESPIKTSEIIVPNKILIAIYYWVFLDWFLNFSVKWPPWRQGEGESPSWNLRNDNPVYIRSILQDRNLTKNY